MLKQYLNYKLSQKLSPQQIQLMKLVKLPILAFEQRLIEEMNDNPALESGPEPDEFEKDDFSDQEFEDYDDSEEETIDTEDINIDEYLSDDETPDYKTQSNNYSDDDEVRESPLAAPVSFHQDLINQLNTFMLESHEREIAEFLVGSIDDMGYIRRSIPDMVDDMAFTQGIYTDEKTVEKMLQVIHELEPVGVGARDLQECLLLQLKHKARTAAVEVASSLIEHHFDDFTHRRYERLVGKFGFTNEQLKTAVHEVEKLNPKPGGSFSGTIRIAEHIVPDFTIRIVDGQLELSLNSRNAPSLHISKDYQDMMQTYKEANDKNGTQKEAVQFIKQKLDSAKWFIDAIKQRQHTLYVTMNAIMNYQRDYLLEGDDAKLRPMILKDIADRVGLDISTISRVANSKYVDTPYGTKLIKEFFSEGIMNNLGQEVSTVEIRNLLLDIIENEDKNNPLNDDSITEMLLEKGYPIARRTVAKYREQLDIPVSRMRRLMQ